MLLFIWQQELSPRAGSLIRKSWFLLLFDPKEVNSFVFWLAILEKTKDNKIFMINRTSTLGPSIHLFICPLIVLHHDMRDTV